MEVEISVILDLEHVLNVAVVKMIINATGVKVFTITNVAWMKQILVIVIEIGEATNPDLTLSHHRTVPNAAVRKNERGY